MVREEAIKSIVVEPRIMKWDYRFLSGIALSICMLVTYATESGNRDAYVSVVSESMLDYFEGLPRSVSRKLDKELADFITQHEDQFFSQKVVTVLVFVDSPYFLFFCCACLRQTEPIKLAKRRSVIIFWDVETKMQNC